MEIKKYKLGDIAKIDISGVDKKSKPLQKVVRLCNFVDVYHNWAITHDLYYSFMVATASDKEIEVLSLKKGQVAFTKDSETRDDIGIPTYIADDFDDVVLGYHTALVTPNKDILDGKYLNAFMNSKYIHKYFENHASGSGQRYTLSNDTLNRIPVFIPTLEKQQFIGNIFSTIDKKIALNKKMNQKLEAMAKRLYDYWFVQFDFPDKNGRPYKTSGGKMVYNEVLKREIPAEWEVKKIKKLISNNISGDWGKEEDSGNYSLRVSCIRGADIVDIMNLPTRYILKTNSGKLLNANDFVIEISGGSPIQSTGRIALITDEVIKRFSNSVICSNFCQAIRLNNENSVSYFNYMWKMFYDNDILFNYEGKTSGIKNFQFDTFVNNYWYIPDEKILITFNKVIKNYTKKIESLKSENMELTALRDKLLPLLMNGQVEVK